MEYFKGIELGNTFRDKSEIRQIAPGEAIVYRDSLWFDREFLEYFMRHARSTKHACRAAFPADDKAFTNYALPLTRDIERGKDTQGNPIYLLDLWYFPDGYTDQVLPIPVPSGYKEKGLYSVPDFMAQDRGDLTHYLPARAALSIESWVYVSYANVIFGVFTRGSRFEEHIKTHNFTALKLLWRGIIEQKQVLTTTEVVKIGKGTVIDPSAVINGPTTIGDNCFIGPGVVIDNSTIGDNVNISQGCQLMLSSVGNNTFLPFRAALFMTVIMENSIFAQNTCLQMCVVGRNTFIGAGSTFTDFNLIGELDDMGHVVPRPIKAANIKGGTGEYGAGRAWRRGGTQLPHRQRHCVSFPGRMIRSNEILVASPARRVISRNVTYEESDHHQLDIAGSVHQRRYPRPDEQKEVEAAWDRW